MALALRSGTRLDFRNLPLDAYLPLSLDQIPDEVRDVEIVLGKQHENTLMAVELFLKEDLRARGITVKFSNREQALPAPTQPTPQRSLSISERAAGKMPMRQASLQRSASVIVRPGTGSTSHSGLRAFLSQLPTEEDPAAVRARFEEFFTLPWDPDVNKRSLTAHQQILFRQIRADRADYVHAFIRSQPALEAFHGAAVSTGYALLHRLFILRKTEGGGNVSVDAPKLVKQLCDALQTAALPVQLAQFTGAVPPGVAQGVRNLASLLQAAGGFYAEAHFNRKSHMAPYLLDAGNTHNFSRMLASWLTLSMARDLLADNERSIGKVEKGMARTNHLWSRAKGTAEENPERTEQTQWGDEWMSRLILFLLAHGCATAVPAPGKAQGKSRLTAGEGEASGSSPGVVPKEAFFAQVRKSVKAVFVSRDSSEREEAGVKEESQGRVRASQLSYEEQEKKLLGALRAFHAEYGEKYSRMAVKSWADKSKSVLHLNSRSAKDEGLRRAEPFRPYFLMMEPSQTEINRWTLGTLRAINENAAFAQALSESPDMKSHMRRLDAILQLRIRSRSPVPEEGGEEDEGGPSSRALRRISSGLSMDIEAQMQSVGSIQTALSAPSRSVSQRGGSYAAGGVKVVEDFFGKVVDVTEKLHGLLVESEGVIEELKRDRDENTNDIARLRAQLEQNQADQLVKEQERDLQMVKILQRLGQLETEKDKLAAQLRTQSDPSGPSQADT